MLHFMLQNLAKRAFTLCLLFPDLLYFSTMASNNKTMHVMYVPLGIANATGGGFH
jgi:hypothetical protein